MPIWSAPLIAFAAAFAILAALLRWRDHLPLDRPNDRSLHQVPVPRIGGLGLTPVALGVGLIVAVDDPLLVSVAVTSALLFAASIFDDYRGLPALPRLLLHLGAAFIVVWLAGLPLWAGVAVAIAIGWMTNLYNFMDGSNGLAGGMALIGFGAYAVAALLAGDTAIAWVSLATVGAASAFLCFNFGSARMFLGDAGSIPLGFLAGALGFVGVERGAWPMWFPAVVFSVFVVDASFTLVRRLLRGDRIWCAHREHAYQRLIRGGWSHTRLALAAYALMLVSAATGIAMAFASGGLEWQGLAALAFEYIILLTWIERRTSRRDAT